MAASHTASAFEDQLLEKIAKSPTSRLVTHLVAGCVLRFLKNNKEVPTNG
jgi:hypothetical protein